MVRGGLGTDLARCFDVMAEVAAERHHAGAEPLAPGERTAVLDLARVVAHRVERSAAPIASYAAGRIMAGSNAGERLALLHALIERIEAEAPAEAPDA